MRTSPRRSPTSSHAGSCLRRRAPGVSSMTRAERRVEQQTRRAAELARRLDALLALQGAERVLDVGCGTGALAHALAPRVREVVAVDSDAAMVAVARGHAPANVRVEQGD